MKCLFADCVIHCLSFSIMKLIHKQKKAVVRLLVLRKKANTCHKNDSTAETSSASSLVKGRAACFFPETLGELGNNCVVTKKRKTIVFYEWRFS